ncbi:hypothetical protein RZE82_05295 [Mollicutes bacterium LVI A0039]|nr:hypothetical protein RZE82_05295 [Mollicutes bacterium LVI A0039]
MTSLKNSLKKDIVPSTIIITKIVEIFQYVVIIIGLLTIGLAMLNGDYLTNVINNNGFITLGNFEIQIFSFGTDFSTNFSLVLQGLFMISIATTLAIIFRNINVILKSLTTNVESEGLRVFTNDTKHRLNVVGTLVICLSLISFIFEAIIQFSNFADEGVFIELPLTSIFLGLLVLCIAQVVEHGIRLQEDVDGLI